MRDQFLLQYYTDQSKSKLKGTINLQHCMELSSNLEGGQERTYTFSLSTPDRVYHFSSESKQQASNWIEIISNACSNNIFFKGSAGVRKNRVADNANSRQSSFSKTSSKTSLKDPYIHLTECYSGEKKPPMVPPRPSKSSSEIRKQLEFSSSGGGPSNDIEYLDLEFSEAFDQVPMDEEEEKTGEEEIIYRNIDFVKTKAFNATRREVEENKYNVSRTHE